MRCRRRIVVDDHGAARRQLVAVEVATLLIELIVTAVCVPAAVIGIVILVRYLLR